MDFTSFCRPETKWALSMYTDMYTSKPLLHWLKLMSYLGLHFNSLALLCLPGFITYSSDNLVLNPGRSSAISTKRLLSILFRIFLVTRLSTMLPKDVWGLSKFSNSSSNSNSNSNSKKFIWHNSTENVYNNHIKQIHSTNCWEILTLVASANRSRKDHPGDYLKK